MSWKTTLEQWQSFDELDPTLKKELLATTDEEALEDAFGGQLSFGTAGMRGVLGVGPNRMNIYTVRSLARERYRKLLH